MIAGFRAQLRRVCVGDDTVALWQVADLDRHVDRVALLAGDDPPEPPYWAHLWSGAETLAAVVPRGRGRALDLGCGLGLTGLVAARRGWRVTFLDRVHTALAFARTSAEASGIDSAVFVAADFTRPPLRSRFDLVLASEVLYDRRAFTPLVGLITLHLARSGRALLTDARRIDTRAFYDALPPAGLRARTTLHQIREEGLPITIQIVEITRI